MNKYTGTWNSNKKPSRSCKVWPSGAVEIYENDEFLFETRISDDTTAIELEELMLESVAKTVVGTFRTRTVDVAEVTKKDMILIQSDSGDYFAYVTTEAYKDHSGYYGLSINGTRKYAKAGATYQVATDPKAVKEAITKNRTSLHR